MTEDVLLKTLVFPLAGKRWAVSLSSVREIIRRPELHPVPNPREHCAGLIMHEGRALAALVLEGSIESEYPYGIIVADRNGAVLLLAEEAGELASLETGELEKGGRRVVRGSLHDPVGPVQLVDHRRLIREGLE